jgi:hypothetical protein
MCESEGSTGRVLDETDEEDDDEEEEELDDANAGAGTKAASSLRFKLTSSAS